MLDSPGLCCLRWQCLLLCFTASAPHKQPSTDLNLEEVMLSGISGGPCLQELGGLLALREEDLTVGKLSHSCRKDCGSEAITGGPENELWWLWSVEFQQGILGQTF